MINHIKKHLESLNLEEDKGEDEEIIDNARFEQAQQVSELLERMDKKVVAGTKWYIISMKWVD